MKNCTLGNKPISREPQNSQNLAQKYFIKVCVVNLLAAIFGDRGIKGFREKGE